MEPNDFMMQTHAPMGNLEGREMLPLDSALSVDIDASIKIHVALARSHSDYVYEKTGQRMSQKGYMGTAFSKDALVKTITAGADSGGKKGWQNTPDAEKETGGEFFPDTRDGMGAYCESIGIDFDKLEAACAARSARILYPEDKDVKLGKDGMLDCATGRRTAMNNTDQADALAIHYLAQFQFQVSFGGKLEDCIGESVEIPAGRATLEIKRMGPAQFFKQGHLTTEAYQNVATVTPAVTKQTWTPGKIMTSIWATEEFNEDIIQAWIPTMERAIAIGRGIARDHMMLRGHTATGAGLNINAYGGARALGSKDPRLNHNGFMGANWDGTLGGGAAGAFKGVQLGGARANLNMVPALRASLNKYGLDPAPLRLIVGPTVRAHFVQDAKARPDTYQLLMTIKDGEVYMVDGVLVICLADSVVTDANTAGLPDYAIWNSEGNPVNLTEAGVYDGTAGGYTTATLVHRGNWLEARKRAFNVQAVKLPLADQIAIVGSERYDIKPIHDSISEAVASGIIATL